MPNAVPALCFFLSTLTLASTFVTAAQTSAVPPPKTSLSDKYGQLPISFEANGGQTDERVKFTARGRGYGLFLTGQEAVLTLHRSRPAATEPDVIRMQLSGANPSAQFVGVDPLPGTANYLIGRDSSKWHTGIRTYSKARFSGVYRGIDVVYYGNQSQLEFDFAVAPHADPRAIQLRFSGLNPKLTAAGDLSIAAGKSRVAFHKPLIYQEANGRRKHIPGGFFINADRSVGFSLGPYNHSQRLIIDPVLAYATYLGGSGGIVNTGDPDDVVNAVAVDSSGSAYVAGMTYSSDFPVTSEAFQATLHPKAQTNAFVSKLDPVGTTLLYSTYLGGSSYDEAFAIAVDSSGNAYVTGFAGSNDFPVTAGAFQATSKRGVSTFVTKLDSTGAGLLYSTYLGDYMNDSGYAIAVDGVGNAFVAGSTFSTELPVTPGAFQTMLKGQQNGFVTEFNPTGTALLYSTYLGGSTYDSAYGMALDASGDAYVAGFTSSSDFPATPGAFQTVLRGQQNAFVTKLNPTGTALLYSTYLGGSGSVARGGDSARAIALDSSANAYVVGYTSSADFPVTPGAFQTTLKNPCCSAFVTKLDSTGSSLLYSTYLGGRVYYGIDVAQTIAVDSSGVADVAGWTGSADFPVTPGALQTTLPGKNLSAFVTRINPTGTALVYSTFMGGPRVVGNGTSAARSVAVDRLGNAYVAGRTGAYDFPVTRGAFQTTNKTPCCSGTGFVARFNVVPAATPTFSPAPGKYIGSVQVTINDATPGSTIRYQLPNSNPTATSPLYTGPITISSGYVTVRAYADSSTNAPSAIARASYSIVAQTPEPVISPASGSYPAGQKITITDANPKVTIRYTTHGSTPTAKSQWYNGPVLLSSPETIRAIAISTSEDNSPVASASYTVH